MLSHIITKMVLDRTCPVCNGLKQYKTTTSAKTERVVCKNCRGSGFMADTEPSVLFVNSIDEVQPGIVSTMESQQMYVTDDISKVSDIKPHRIYIYNRHVDTGALADLCEGRLKEIHMYFG